MDTHLVISALGQDRLGIVNDLSKAILETGCNILDSRMSVLGGEFAIILLVEGNWSTVAKLENKLPTLESKLDLALLTKRTIPRPPGSDLLPYAIEVVSIDHQGIVNQLATFFAQRNINIEDLRTERYAAPHTGTPMFTVHVVVGIPASQHIGALREQFLAFCDEYNLDAVMEPMKN